MDLFTLQPIKRGTYVLGLIVIIALSNLALFLFRGNLYGQSMVTAMIVFSLFIAIAKIIWDYKRIKDISTNKLYLLFLLIPILSGLVAPIMKIAMFDKETNNMMSLFFSNSNSELLSMFLVFGVIAVLSFFYTLFLIFKKGNINSVLSPTI